MTDNPKKPVFVKLPDNIGTMTEAEINAWVDGIVPDLIEKVKQEPKSGADKE